METTKLSDKDPLKLFESTNIDDVAGCLRYKGKAKTIEEMDAAVTEEARRQDKWLPSK